MTVTSQRSQSNKSCISQTTVKPWAVDNETGSLFCDGGGKEEWQDIFFWQDIFLIMSQWGNKFVVNFEHWSLWTPPAHHQKIPYVFRKLPKQLFKIKFGARIVWLWNFKFISKFKLWIPGDYMTKWADRIPSTKLETKSAWM